jgi:ATP-binding cassette subfamily B protein
MHDKTIIVIAHRLGTVVNMDRILVFQNGAIIQDGHHKELLASAGLYRELWNLQLGGKLPDLQ